MIDAPATARQGTFCPEALASSQAFGGNPLVSPEMTICPGQLRFAKATPLSSHTVRASASSNPDQGRHGPVGGVGIAPKDVSWDHAGRPQRHRTPAVVSASWNHLDEERRSSPHQTRAPFQQQSIRYPAHHVHPRLRVLRFGEFGFRPAKAHSRQIIAKGVVRLLEKLPRGGGLLRHVFAHPHKLGSLTGKQQRCLLHVACTVNYKAALQKSGF